MQYVTKFDHLLRNSYDATKIDRIEEDQQIINILSSTLAAPAGDMSLCKIR
jgi:hypothetical protein